MAATVAGSGFRPASCLLGSIPGVAKKIRNVRTVIANSTATIPISRLTTKANTGYSRTRTLARGSSASRTPSPSTFSASTVSTMKIPGTIATSGRV